MKMLDSNSLSISGCATAPAKVILFGEHSVVHGTPAIAVALNLRSHARVQIQKSDAPRLTVKSPAMKLEVSFSSKQLDTLGQGSGSNNDSTPLDPIALGFYNVSHLLQMDGFEASLTIDSEIPIGAGLGSSASVATSSVGAFLAAFKGEIDSLQVREIAFRSEELTHGKPSGIDNTVIALGGLVYFIRGQKPRRKTLSAEIPLVIANTKIPRSTATLVSNVASLFERKPRAVQNLFDSISDIVEQGLQALLKSDLEDLGELMNINHGILHALGVSHPLLDRYVWVARESGALGAKLTGAGGGGCMIALAKDTHHANEIKQELIKAGADAFTSVLTNKGVEKC